VGLPRWLLLVHHLPAEPSNLRVKAWRRLRAVGAVLVKNSVYVLPRNRESREDLEWIRGEIVAQGGEAVVFAADAVDDLADDEVVEAFVQARRVDWQDLSARAAALRERREKSPGNDEALEREFKALRNRAAQVDRIDYFRAPGRDEALSALDVAASTRAPRTVPSRSAIQAGAAGGYEARRWVTRPRPGVDRMASAWLIHRFIDRQARFEFAERLPADDDVVPFDMFGVEFGHHGEQCTFETLMASFGLDEPALDRLGRIVRTLDLKDESGLDAEAATVGRLVGGLREAVEVDRELLERGMLLFEALYRSFRREAGGVPAT
jgi:hypothetical protein